MKRLHVHLPALFLLLLGAMSTLLVVRALGQPDDYLWSVSSIICLVVLPGAYLVALLISFLRGRNAVLNLFFLSLSVLSALYLAEVALIAAGPHITLPRDFDRRSKFEVVQELRAAGVPVVPSIHPKHFLQSSLDVSGTSVLPLAGVPKTMTVFCNETGTYYLYESDEYGFTNPTGLHSTQLDLALVGDSFTQGFCAPGGTSYAERIRTHIPRTLNLGNNGNGPLIELASLREFLPARRPRYVFWFYFEGNDIQDLSHELEHPILARYLADAQYSQELSGRVDEYDSALRHYAEKQYTAEQESRGKFLGTLPTQIRLWMGLWHVRALLGINDIRREWILSRRNPNISDSRIEAGFNTIISEAKERVESWGGQLVVVYLPSYRTFGYEIIHPWRQRVLKILKTNNITTLDVLTVFAQVRDPVSLYNYKKEGHYTTEGNALVAQVVLQFLQEKKFQTVGQLVPVYSAHPLPAHSDTVSSLAR